MAATEEPSATTHPAQGSAESRPAEGQPPGAYPYPYPYPAPVPVPVPGKPFVPGWGLYAFTLSSLAAGLDGASIPGWNFGLVALAFLACLVIGFTWMVAFAVAGGETRLRINRITWARWAGIPILGLVTLGLIMFNVPGTVRFSVSRPALQHAADEAQAGRAPGSGWIGLYLVDAVHAYPDGVTTFQVSGARGCGYAYDSKDTLSLDSGSESEDEGYPMSEVAPRWWYWCPDGWD